LGSSIAKVQMARLEQVFALQRPPLRCQVAVALIPKKTSLAYVWTLRSDTERKALAEHLDADWQSTPLPEPRFDVAPTQYAPVLLQDDGRRVLDMYRWGLIPSRAKDPAIGNRIINARADVGEKPALRTAFERRRCLMPASGLYEWQKTLRGKVPHWIHPARGNPLTFARLTPNDAEPVYTYTVLTTTANAFMQRLHDRMPVVLSPGRRDTWLDPDAKPDQLAELLRPAEDDLLATHAVSPRVNAPANDAPQCIEPFGAE
jgi:putative SOS response-associated peptidase YedK